MKMKLKYMMAVLTVALLSSCDDFLDREPLSSVTGEEYFTSVDQLESYSISKYNDIFKEVFWAVDPVKLDDATDNMVLTTPSQQYFEKGYWQVPESGGNWNFTLIRYCNYFLEQVMPKYNKGLISGSDDEIRHYIGEIFFIRAYAYYKMLVKFGDLPIIKNVLPDDKATMIEYGKRQPRNEVARFILDDLDNAIELMEPQGFKNNTRLNKQAAYLLKSRVALFEASFERYHQGTGRVPGDADWPGKTVHPNYQYDGEKEVNFFLDQAMEAAASVADKITLTTNTYKLNPDNNVTSGWNPYFEMFSAVNLGTYKEVLFWKAYSSTSAVAMTHSESTNAAYGGNYGLTKDYIESFLMKDGLPRYACSSAYPYKGDVAIDSVKTNRDGRMGLFVFGESDKITTSKTFDTPNLFGVSGYSTNRDVTGYRVRKYLSYDPAQSKTTGLNTTGCVIFRAAEAYLNYIEADYMRNGSVSSKSAAYWSALRKRAGVDPNFTKTINATDLSKESDWGKYSGEKLVDATLFNIRRERRCELIGEGMRFNDLLRWRSFDMLQKTPYYIPRGINFWDKIHENYAAKYIVDDGSATATVSNASRYGKYLCPFSANETDANKFKEGYAGWAKAYYLYPVPIKEITLLSPDNTIENSVLYQNIYWPNEISGTATE